MVFVGILFSCPKNKRWRYNQACHLFCDRPENLEELGQKIEQMEKKYDKQFRIVFEAIQQLLTEEKKAKRRIGF